MEDKVEEIVDQTKVAESVEAKIPYDMTKMFLVKPLDPIMVKKEFSKPVPAEEQKSAEDGVDAVDYDKVETEVKEVESDYRKGVVIKVPLDYQRSMNDEKYPTTPIHVGDIIVYPTRYAKWFDLLKDSQMISSFDIVAIVR